MKRPPFPVIALVIFLLAGAAAGVWWLIGSGNHRDDALMLYGNVEIRDAQLAFDEQGRITEVLVEEGQVVAAGQVIARIESDRLASQLAEAKARRGAQQEVVRRLTSGTRPQEIAAAEARLTAAEARRRNAERLVGRLTSTARARATAQQELDDARAELDVARADADSARETLDLAREGFREEEIAEARAVLKAREAEIALLETRLEDTVLLAPSKGVVQSRVLEPGEMATPTRPVVVLALNDPKWVRAWLPAPDLGRVRSGMPAKVYSDSFPERAFQGWVGFMSPQAEFTPKSVQTTDLRTQLVYETRIWVDDPGDELRLGMPVTVAVEVPTSGQAVAKPGD
jgi:HlyD family secretion protein